MAITSYKEIFQKAYGGKKVLVTGHTGFKGSWLLVWLKQLGAIVKGYALRPNPNELYEMIDGDSYCDSVLGDIRDKERLYEAVVKFEPDFIFHLAAQPLVRLSYELPLYTFEVNANGTAHLLEAIRALQKKCCVVIVTTDKVYENIGLEYAYKEDDRLGGYDPYSASKAAAEIIVSSYRSSFFNANDFEKHNKAVATARAGNVIGGGDFSKDRIVPDIIRALQNDESIVVRNPSAIRPWQHILDPLGGYLLLGAKLSQDPQQFMAAWNFGPRNGDVLNVEELVKYAIKFWGNGNYECPQLVTQPHEAHFLKLDITKSLDSLHWEPRLNALQSIEHTVYEYKQLIKGNNGVISEQIAGFDRP